MKKLIIPLTFILLLAGCGNEEKELICTNSTSSNNLISNTTYEIKYKEDKTKYVKIIYDYKNNVEDTDGVNADTDGLTENNDDKANDEIIDGKVGDAIDDATNAITETILDLAGLKDTYNNQITDYENIDGFTYTIEKNNDEEYKIVYEIDLTKINDNDLSNFNISRDFSNLKDTMENNGYTCN